MLVARKCLEDVASHDIRKSRLQTILVTKKDLQKNTENNNLLL